MKKLVLIIGVVAFLAVFAIPAQAGTSVKQVENTVMVPDGDKKSESGDKEKANCDKAEKKSCEKKKSSCSKEKE